MAPGLEAGKGAAARVCSGVGPEQLSLEDWSLRPRTPSPSQGVEDRSTGEAPGWVAESKALIQTDLAPKLRAHKPCDPGQVLSIYKQSEPRFLHLPEQEDGSFSVRSGLTNVCGSA